MSLASTFMQTGSAAHRCSPQGPIKNLALPQANTAVRKSVRCASSADQQVNTAHGQDALLTRRTLMSTTLGTLLTAASLVTWDPVHAEEAPEPVEEVPAEPPITTVFVAGATGNTGRRVVEQARAAGYSVRAGVRDLGKGKKLFGSDPGVTLVLADVTKGVKPLAEAIGDSQAVISAIGAAGLFGSSPANVDEQGAINLVDAAKASGVRKFVMVSSLLTNAAAVGQAENPNYKFLNLFGQVLDHKLVAELYLRSSGIQYTIVRPGGLTNEPASKIGNLIVRPEDSLFGLDTEPGREISRDTVAALTVEALKQDAAKNKVVEVLEAPGAPALDRYRWFTAA